MVKLRWFLMGVAATCLAAFAGVLTALKQVEGVGANQRPSKAEGWIARRLRAAVTSGETIDLKNPFQATPASLAEAKEHWADHCASCHANDGSGDSSIGKSLYPPAPDMRAAETQRLTDGQLFSIIQDGVRLTGMPAWGKTAADAEASWKLVLLIRRLPQISRAEVKAMEKLNPRTPREMLEEQEELKFLRGENTDEPAPQHRH